MDMYTTHPSIKYVKDAIHACGELRAIYSMKLLKHPSAVEMGTKPNHKRLPSACMKKT